jgi:hypothetical protein
MDNLNINLLSLPTSVLKTIKLMVQSENSDIE